MAVDHPLRESPHVVGVVASASAEQLHAASLSDCRDREPVPTFDERQDFDRRR